MATLTRRPRQRVLEIGQNLLKDRSKEQGDALRGLLTLEATKWQYTTGVRNQETISPDTWAMCSRFGSSGESGNSTGTFSTVTAAIPRFIQMARVLSQVSAADIDRLGSERSDFSGSRSTTPYKRDLKNLEFHLLDTGTLPSKRMARNREADSDFLGKQLTK